VADVWRWIDRGIVPAHRDSRGNICIESDKVPQLQFPRREARRDDAGNLWMVTGIPDQESVMKQLRALREAIGRRRNGVPLPDSSEDIRLAREERDREVDAWLLPGETALLSRPGEET
jgi:hypothetical protein